MIAKTGNSFCINIDSFRCTSLIEGVAVVGRKNYCDSWRYDNLTYNLKVAIYMRWSENMDRDACIYLIYWEER